MRPARFLVLPSLLWFMPWTAHAQAEVCQLTGHAGPDGADLACTPLVLCSSDADCDSGLLPTSCDRASGVCLPECATLVSCATNEDCLAIDPGARCILVDSSGSLPDGGYCEAPTIPVVYCENATGTTTALAVLACHTLPFSDTLAPSWFDGDCDGDGCPNNNDEQPCDPGGGCGAPLLRERACSRRLIEGGPERCTLVRESGAPRVSCATEHLCSDASGCPQGFACTMGTCQPLICGTVYGCRADSDCEGTPLGDGACVPAPDTFGVDRGGDGFCTFPSFRTEGRCAGMLPSCLETPSGLPTLDFFQGDCDEDGCANGSDDTVCDAGFTTCTPTTSIACGVPLEVPSEGDAGVPADAAGLDGGVPSFDAAPFDAPSPPAVSFAGGGGVRCAAGPRSRAPWIPFALLVALSLLRARLRHDPSRSRKAADMA